MVPDHPDFDQAVHATALGTEHVFVWGGLRSVKGERYELTADGYAWPIPARD